MSKPPIKIIGLTATPFRLASFYKMTGNRWQPWETVTTTKMITRYKEKAWSNMVYVMNTQTLIDKGYLCPLKYEDKKFYFHEQLTTNKSASDFDLEAFEELIGDKEPYVAQHIVDAQKRHTSILVFCVSVSQAERLSKAVTGSRMISGETPKKEREEIIKGFKDKSIKVVFNMGVLTHGFDHPCLDCIYTIRPTRSINLWSQMLGRGTRLAEGKTHCTVYDFSGNLKSIGSLESIWIDKIDGLWNVKTTKFPDGCHNKELYTFRLMPRKEEYVQGQFI